MNLRRTAVLSTVGLLVVLYGPATALATGGSVTVGTQTEAWYVTTTSDTCSEVDCSLLPPTNYPKNTLHVGISGGTPTTATFIELGLFNANLPFDATLVAGTLMLPVDTAEADGSLRPEQANLRVCQVTGSISPAEASPEEPPETDCTKSAPGGYSAEPAPTFSVDLEPFLSAWSGGEAAALAIMPAPGAEKRSETWHVAFYGKNHATAHEDAPAAANRQGASASIERESPLPGDQVDAPEPSTQRDAHVSSQAEEGPQPITARLTYEVAEEDQSAFSPFPPSVLAPPLAPSVPSVSPRGLPPEAPELATAPPPTTAEPRQVDVTPLAPAPVAAPSYASIPYPYPAAWLVPLLLLIGVVMTGRSLTRNLERPERSMA